MATEDASHRTASSETTVHLFESDITAIADIMLKKLKERPSEDPDNPGTAQR